MDIRKFISRIIRGSSDQKGMALVLVMTFVGLMSLSLMSLALMVRRDMNLVERVKKTDQARFLAEAGINHALAEIRTSGFQERTDFTGSLDTGSYSVVYFSVGGRELIISTGSAAGVSSTAILEVKDNTPTAMNYFSGAENDIKINALVTVSSVSGDIHANNNVYLKAGPIVSSFSVTGDVSATGIVMEGTRHNQSDLWDWKVYINGANSDGAAVSEGAPRITFPTFNFNSYRQAAIDSGDYYSGDVTFNNVTLSPANGIVYVDGDAEFRGVCVINGGVIANSIRVINTLRQNKALNRNVILSRNGDIRVWGRLETQEALVFAAQDIISMQVLAVLEVNGILLAGRDVNMWNVVTRIVYTYVPMSPADMFGEEGTDVFEVVAWTR
ncbi:MAG: hypothetical protein WCV56_01290 [Candidatus Omnitrophota bacterium]